MVREPATMTLARPVQFGYAAKPWWKFEHLQRFNRIVMPVCRRF